MGKTTDRLLKAAEEIWSTYHEHPFVRGLADGTLPKDKFQFYMLQDYVYLFDYARVFAVGVAKAKDPEVMRIFSGYVKQILDGEMDVHRDYMARLGISPADAERTVPALDNLSYTSYMLRVAYDEGAAEVTAAILSCALSYEEIAKEILRRNPDAGKHPFFGEWVESYASEGYHEANEELVRLMEQLSEGCSEQELRHLEEIFVISSRYEGRFWDLGWEKKL